MPGMSRAEILADLQASLAEAASVFAAGDGLDFERHLDLAVEAYGTLRPIRRTGTATLVADQADYAVPADYARFGAHLWGRNPRVTVQPWEASWPGPLPRVQETQSDAGAVQISLDPPPSSFQIATLGAAFKFHYYALHRVAEAAADTTVPAADRGLLLLRAQAEACRELAMRNVKKPVQMRDGLLSTPRNGTPAALFQALMEEWDRRMLH